MLMKCMDIVSHMYYLLAAIGSGSLGKGVESETCTSACRAPSHTFFRLLCVRLRKFACKSIMAVPDVCTCQIVNFDCGTT